MLPPGSAAWESRGRDVQAAHWPAAPPRAAISCYWGEGQGAALKGPRRSPRTLLGAWQRPRLGLGEGSVASRGVAAGARTRPARVAPQWGVGGSAAPLKKLSSHRAALPSRGVRRVRAAPPPPRSHWLAAPGAHL